MTVGEWHGSMYNAGSIFTIYNRAVLCVGLCLASITQGALLLYNRAVLSALDYPYGSFYRIHPIYRVV